MLASIWGLFFGLTLSCSDPGGGAGAGLQRYEYAETHMGSEFRIVLYSLDEASARRASRSAFDRIAALDAKLSDYKPDSELMQLCDRAGGPPIRVSDDLLDILQRSKWMFEKHRCGIDRALVAGAGDIVVSGPPPDREGWVIGIAPLRDPQGTPEVLLSLHDAAISTAGDTERFVVIDGRRYSHIVDPRTGLGIVDRATVTVVSDDGATADALDTAVYGLGPEQGLRLVESIDGTAACIMREATEGLQKFESRRFARIPRVLPGHTSDPAIRLRP
jgi:thiamine biosynthesis lipoprotein ApbE